MAKVFNDPIHGHIELHPLLVRIIDTPEFQRLRYIKQLGGGYFVYPGASHNRFEHSIGVAYLAGKLAEALKSKQSKELDEIEERLKEEETEKLKSRQADLKKSLISDRDVLCVQIAGLCHDLGHGPFSHLFDRMFNPEADPKPDPEHEDWKHEDASEAMFDYLVTNRLKEDKEVKKLLPADLTFIKEMINPKKPRDCGHQREEKSFLYEIVSNEQNGIDVDKFDYFARDCHHLGIKNNFDHQRFIMFARVCEVNEWKHICSREKEVANLYDMFHTRNSLHRRAYQHRVTKSVEIMIKDALLKADKHIQFKSSTGEMLPLSQAKNDMEAYSKLTDQVLEEIYKSTSNSLMEAREIIQRIMTRKLYWFVGQAKPKKDQEKISKEKKESLKRKLEEDMPGMKFEVIVVTMDYGMKDKDPINNTYFYRKNEPNKGFTIPKSKVSKLLPECFSEEILRVYLKNHEDEHVKKAEAQTHFKDWCNKNDFEVDREDDDDDASAASCAAAGTEK